jgi:hypothetical protein
MLSLTVRSGPVGSPETHRVARVYIGSPPDNGPHPGYRGPITIDVVGVYVSRHCDYISEGSTYAEGYEWERVYAAEASDLLVPWHRVDLIALDEGAGWEAEADVA